MPQTVETADPRSAGQLREAMTDQLVADGWITSPEVEAAFRSVPRHEFVPRGTTLEAAYGARGSGRSPRRTRKARTCRR